MRLGLWTFLGCASVILPVAAGESPEAAAIRSTGVASGLVVVVGASDTALAETLTA